METLIQLKNYYRDLSANQPFAIPDLRSSPLEQIILVRHGKPDIHKGGLFSHAGAAEFVRKYDETGIRNFSGSPFLLDEIPVTTVYTSHLKRAIQTAQLIFSSDEFEFIPDRRFREFERKVLPWLSFLPMPLHYWTYLSRLLWMFGVGDKGIESFREAKKRTAENAGYLSRIAEEDKTVLLVAHGLHNIYLAKALKDQSWQLVRKGGNGYISVNILAREEN